MNKEFIELAKPMVEKAVSGVDFCREQAPLLIQEFYRAEIFGRLFAMFFSLAWIVVAFFIIKREKRRLFDSDVKYKDENIFWDGSGAFGIVLVLLYSIFTVMILVALLCSVYDLMYVSLFPKMYLIKYFLR